MNQPTQFLDELAWRGLLHQTTGDGALRAHLTGTARRVYAGFDPTADSLTIGNLVPIMLLAHAQRAGHAPVVVMGGGTGLIGDPSGKTAERTLRTREDVEANVAAQGPIFERVLDFSPPTPSRPNSAVLVNNLDWLGKLTYIEALRDIGKHFSVNMMIQKESVRERLHAREQGISYTEFSYMILQAYDFLHLNRSMGVTVQIGGSDQWGNIVAGADLIRRFRSHEAGGSDGAEDAFGLTAPLVTKADGGKFGKTESGAVWLSAHRTSPYAYYQFWLNAADEDAVRFLKIFTFLPREEVEGLAARQAGEPGARAAQRRLAQEATRIMHGETGVAQAEAAAQALFSGDLAGLSVETLEEVFATVPRSSHDRALLNGEGVSLVEVLAQTSLASSKSQARQSLAEGSVSVNGRKAGPEARLTTADLLHGKVIALRRGKKTWHVTRWE